MSFNVRGFNGRCYCGKTISPNVHCCRACFDSGKYLRHLGIMSATGHIIATIGGGTAWDLDNPTSRTTEEISSEMSKIYGEPFECLSSTKDKADLTIVETYDGLNIRVCDLEMVFNDAGIIDRTHGEGWETVLRPLERYAIILARRTYAERKRRIT